MIPHVKMLLKEEKEDGKLDSSFVKYWYIRNPAVVKNDEWGFIVGYYPGNKESDRIPRFKVITLNEDRTKYVLTDWNKDSCYIAHRNELPKNFPDYLPKRIRTMKKIHSQLIKNNKKPIERKKERISKIKK